MTPQRKLPAFQFYPGDWLKDTSLRATSVEARGLWIDMLCFMHESPRRGWLMLTISAPMTTEQLARAAGIQAEICQQLLSELESNGVVTVEQIADVGVAYVSRRMLRDEATREKLSEAGKRGGRPVEKGDPKPTPKGGEGSSSSSSPSPSPSTLKRKAVLLANEKGCTNEAAQRSIEYGELVDAVWKQIPNRCRREMQTTKNSIGPLINQIAQEENGSHEHAAKYLGERIRAYYLSAEGRSQYFRKPVRWLSERGWEESDEAWNARDNGKGPM